MIEVAILIGTIAQKDILIGISIRTQFKKEGQGIPISIGIEIGVTTTKTQKIGKEAALVLKIGNTDEDLTLPPEVHLTSKIGVIRIGARKEIEIGM